MEIDSSSHLLIIGCGYVGTQVGLAYQKAGGVVSGTTRDPQRAKELKTLGINPILSDLTTAKGFSEFGKNDYVLLCVAPAQSNSVSYDEIYNKGIKRVLTYLTHFPPRKKLIYTSSVGVYDIQDGGWVDESSPVNPSTERAKSLIQAEQHVLRAPFPKIVLRLGGIYGPSRNRVEDIQSKEFNKDDLKKYVNLIYIEDVVKSILFLFHKQKTETLYNGVDTNPVSRLELYSWIAKQMGAPLKLIKEKKGADRSRLFQNKRCSNKKLIASGYEFICPSYREGYQQILKLRESG